MAGQVQHRQIFSDIVPDLKLHRRAGAARASQHRQPDRRGGGRPRARGHHAPALGRVPGGPAGAAGADDAATPRRRRAEGRRLRRDRRPRPGGDGPRADGGREGTRGRGARGDGGHGRDDPPRRAHRRAGHHGGQGVEAEAGHALRRARRGAGHARRDGRGRRARAGDRRLPHPADRPSRLPGAGRFAAGGRLGPRPRGGGGTCRMPDVVRAGVIGVGALGRHHARVWAATPGAALAGVYDTDAGRAAAVAAEYGCPACPDVADAARRHGGRLGRGAHRVRTTPWPARRSRPDATCCSRSR